jgi:hypothetical protein
MALSSNSITAKNVVSFIYSYLFQDLLDSFSCGCIVEELKARKKGE